MDNLSQLRAILASKGYSQSASTADQQIGLPPISVHLHPLLKSPVVLIGTDGDIALDYQAAIVAAATERR